MKNMKMKNTNIRIRKRIRIFIRNTNIRMFEYSFPSLFKTEFQPEARLYQVPVVCFWLGDFKSYSTAQGHMEMRPQFKA